MKTRKYFMVAALLSLAMTAHAQGNNTRNGGPDGDYESLAERVAKIEKKTDAFNVYFNYAASAQINDFSGDTGDKWGATFKNKQARLEIKGNITDKLSYRFRHRLNKSNAAKDDNFAKATDILMVGYQFNDKIGVQAGKMCQIWGGFEFDENPMYIYQYSDMVDYMDNFQVGAVVSFKPVPTQEIAVEISRTDNDRLKDIYGEDAKTLSTRGLRDLKQAKTPLTYIVNWNGSFFGDKFQTRWAWGLQTQAEGHYSRMLTLGQKLNLDKIQWYFDYMGEFDDLDRLGIATSELVTAPGVHLGKVHYNSFITKLNWQFAPQWNLMLKGCYETTTVKGGNFDKYRKSWLYAGSVEYYPVKSQDFRVFLAYIGRSCKYTEQAKALADLDNYNTNRIELGFMYRIKVF